MSDAEDLYIPTFDDVLQARERIEPYIHRTPVLTSSFFDQLTGAKLFFKCENFQKAGAFKVRGASNAVFGLSEEQAPKGVATHSSGNHALSLSYAAGRRGIPVSVVMPRTAPEAKKAAVRGYGGEVFECEPSTDRARGNAGRPGGAYRGRLRTSLQRSSCDCGPGHLFARITRKMSMGWMLSSRRSAAAV